MRDHGVAGRVAVVLAVAAMMIGGAILPAQARQRASERISVNIQSNHRTFASGERIIFRISVSNPADREDISLSATYPHMLRSVELTRTGELSWRYETTASGRGARTLTVVASAPSERLLRWAKARRAKLMRRRRRIESCWWLPRWWKSLRLHLIDVQIAYLDRLIAHPVVPVASARRRIRRRSTAWSAPRRWACACPWASTRPISASRCKACGT